MAHPKDWFRRRLAQPNERPAAAAAVDDPFAGDGVLDLGQATAPDREPAKAGERRLHGFIERRGPIPAPRRPMVKPSGITIDRSAFTVRPEIVRTGPGAAPRYEAGAASVSVTPKPFSIQPVPLAAVRPQPERSPAAQKEPAQNEQAKFALAAPGIAWRRQPPTDGETSNARLRDAFTPTRPKQNAALFSGRFRQMQRIIAAIEEERAHVMIYGERGSGKTSLANVLAGKAEEAGYLVARFACNSELSFEDIFRGFLRHLPASLVADTLVAGAHNLEELLPSGHCGITELIGVFERIAHKHVVLIIDEYDRVTTEETQAKLAELIKNMSDVGAPVTLLIIGVAENVSQLLGKHPSLQRTIVTIPMPLMSARELDGILATGEEKSGMRFDPPVRRQIVEFAQGLPYHAQLLGLFAARSATRRRASAIERSDLRYAVERAAEEAEARLKQAYDLAVGPHENASFRDVLFYAARCRTDEFGSFTAADVAAAANELGQEGLSLLALQYPLKKLTEPSRGAVLRRIITGGGLRYQFSSQSMRFHALLRQAVKRGLV
jgi:Cdc6-like AAA superfamily ATPase